MTITTEITLPSCVDWAACEAEHERERADDELLRELAESEAEEHAVEARYGGDWPRSDARGRGLATW